VTKGTILTLRLALKVLKHEELRVLVAPNIGTFVDEALAEIDGLYDENGNEAGVIVGRLISAKRAT
jgi:hypothetical protein